MNAHARRRIVDAVARGACLAGVLVALVPLVSVLAYITLKGIGGLSWDLLTGLPKPVGEPGGGFGNALVGSLVLVGIASAVGIPEGVLAGVYLASKIGRAHV